MPCSAYILYYVYVSLLGLSHSPKNPKNYFLLRSLSGSFVQQTPVAWTFLCTYMCLEFFWGLARTPKICVRMFGDPVWRSRSESSNQFLNGTHAWSRFCTCQLVLLTLRWRRPQPFHPPNRNLRKSFSKSDQSQVVTILFHHGISPTHQPLSSVMSITP